MSAKTATVARDFFASDEMCWVGRRCTPRQVTLRPRRLAAAASFTAMLTLVFAFLVLNKSSADMYAPWIIVVVSAYLFVLSMYLYISAALSKVEIAAGRVRVQNGVRVHEFQLADVSTVYGGMFPSVVVGRRQVPLWGIGGKRGVRRFHMIAQQADLGPGESVRYAVVTSWWSCPHSVVELLAGWVLYVTHFAL